MLIDAKVPARAKKASLRTKEVRLALQLLVDSQLANIGQWIGEVAKGVPKLDGNGKPCVDAQGSPVFLVRPDPASAVKLVSDLAEYVVPKLSRTELAVEQLADRPIEEMSVSELKRLVAERLGQAAPEVIDVEPMRPLTEREERRPPWYEQTALGRSSASTDPEDR